MQIFRMFYFAKIPLIYMLLVSMLFAAPARAGDGVVLNSTVLSGKDGDVIAFVGRKISFEGNNSPEYETITMPDGQIVKRKIFNWDSRYEARYKVLAKVSGKIKNDTVDFEVFDHYGRPRLPHIQTPLVFLVNANGRRWVQSKYNNYSVSQTTDGDWAICGAPARYKEAVDQGERYVRSLTFVDSIKDHNGQTCQAGTRVKDIFQYQNETRFLPDKRRVACNLELGLPKYVIAGTGSAPDAAEIDRAHTDCVEQLKSEDGAK